MIPQFMTSFDIDCRMSGLGDLIVRISVGEEKVQSLFKSSSMFFFNYKVNFRDEDF